MGFFKDFKRDFAQAVNELMPDKDELANEYDDEDMVNTFDDMDNMDIAPEDMMEDLDDYTIDDRHIVDPNAQEKVYEMERPESDYGEEEQPKEESVFDTVPSAEIISDADNDMEGEFGQDFAQEMVSDFINPEVVQVETVAIDLEAQKTEEDSQLDELEDELESLEGLDEEDMLENTEDALAVDYNEPSETVNEEYLNVDLSKAVEAAILKNEEDSDVPTSVNADMEDNSMSDTKVESRDKEQDINSILTDDTTYITKGTTIKGNLETDGSVDVIGTVEGNISCGGKLIVGGLIIGNVTAGEVYANAAKIEGEVICDGSVKIGVGTVVVGNVNATSAVIAGAVNGDIDVHGPVIVDSTAVIMGNIKSRSVQINNGAVIEGFCSQCYSEIDVKSFFE